MRPRSPGMTLYNKLVRSGFEVTLSRADSRRPDDDVTLRVPGAELGADKLELLAYEVDLHGGRMLVDQRGVFTIRFEREPS